MDIKEIRQLVKLMADNELCELKLEEDDQKIHIKRGGGDVVTVPAATMIPAAMPAAPAVVPVSQAAPEQVEAEVASDLLEIKSPMVGTIYLASSPDSPDFATEGDKIDSETVVCIIEAMKVMNEIKAECRGTIAEICVENAQPVEFGQVLYRVKP